jgi:hypothetical protein
MSDRVLERLQTMNECVRIYVNARANDDAIRVGWLEEEVDATDALLAAIAKERDELREAVALHARTLDDRALGHPEHLKRDRDAIDNDLYNAVRATDPAWWDKRVPGLGAAA